MFHRAVKKSRAKYHQHNSESWPHVSWKVTVLELILEVLHTALVINMIPLHSLLRIDDGQISTIWTVPIIIIIIIYIYIALFFGPYKCFTWKGGISSATTNGWCDGSHIAPERPPHTSLLVERRQSQCTSTNANKVFKSIQKTVVIDRVERSAKIQEH